VFDLHGPSVAVGYAAPHRSSLCTRPATVCVPVRRRPRWSVASICLLHPYPFIGFTKASMLSASGRCRAFDAAPTAMCGLKRGGRPAEPLDKALADGDSIQAVISPRESIRTAAARRASRSPAAKAKADLLREVLGRSGLSADQIDYVEAHGTGTAIGDPIEPRPSARSMDVIESAASPPDRIGQESTTSVISESASGMAGLIKTILVLKNRGTAAVSPLDDAQPAHRFCRAEHRSGHALPSLGEAGPEAIGCAVNSFALVERMRTSCWQEFRVAGECRGGSRAMIALVSIGAHAAGLARTGRALCKAAEADAGLDYDIA